MSKSQGLEHVEQALERIQSATDAVGKLSGLNEDWRTDRLARLAATADLLRRTMDRFFLKTRMCLPFARKCAQAAEKLDAVLGELGAGPASDAQPRLTAALEALEKAARTLDERSLMQGMAIT